MTTHPIENLENFYKHAYYEVIYEHMIQEPPDYDLLIEILDNIKQKLSRILRDGSPLKAEIDQNIDIQFIKQMLINQAFSMNDFKQLIQYTFDKCKQLEAPARDQYTQQKLNETIAKIHQNEKFQDVAIFFIKNIDDCIDNIYIDLHNYYTI